ncbi:MAG: IS630 family transposase [Chloroflexi bacterium]|nr:IS630 family transposase [Chloroflexota bacterium]
MSCATITISLDDQERQALEAQIRTTQERKMADRLRVLLYRAKGYAIQCIAELLQMSRNHVTELLRRYRAGGVAAVLRPDQYKGSQPHLTVEQQQALKIELKTHIYVTAAQVSAWVKAQWQVQYDVSGMNKLLKRLGFSYKKNRLVPSKADPELQRLFVRWFAGLCQRLGPEDRIYFGDAVHFKHNAEAGYAWSLKGEPYLIPANSGRQRYNVFGAYCVQTQEGVFLLTEANIDQDKLVEFLPLLRTQHPGPGKLYLLLDNARYNYTQAVSAEARRQGIQLDYLPPYSPNLNPIERLWKFARKEFFKDKYRETFAIFRSQLDDFFAHLDQYRDRLRSLITTNFELLPECWQSLPPA